MDNIKSKDVAIIGAGPVGLFASFQAGMLGMTSCLIDTLPKIGGQCAVLYPEKPIYDIPGYPKISGQNLVDALIEQSDPYSPEYILEAQVVSLQQLDNIFRLETSNGILIEVKSVIIAAGCGAFGPKKPDIFDIESYESKSVFYSITNKGMFAGKKIMIAGGGDSAIDWTIDLSMIANKIYLLHRREKFRCIPHNMQKVKELEQQGKVEMIIPYQLHDLEGNNGQINKVIVKDLKKNYKKIECDYLLPFYGLSMDLGPIRDWGLNLNSNHIIVDSQYYQTSIDGIYAVGDIASYTGKLKLILTGFAEVSSALHHAYKRVFDGKALHFQYSTSKGIKGF